MKSIKQLSLAFIIPIIIFVISLGVTNMSFFSSKFFLVTDAKAQYVSLFAYFQQFLQGQESLYYSFQKVMGGNMIGTFAYYLASPFNLILLFFTKRTLIYGMLLIITLKIGLSGLTMYSYLKSKNENKHQQTLYLFSTIYALSGFIVVYFFNSMWLDSVLLAPLVLMGIDNIVKNKSSLLYGVSLFVAIFSNYYMGFMLCIFSLLYFIYQILLKYKVKTDLKLIIPISFKFFFVSLLAGLMSSALLLPTLYEVVNTLGRLGEFKDIPNPLEPFALMARFMVGAHDYENILNKVTPAIYVGIITLPLLYFYFINKNIEKREKILSGLFLLFFIASLFFNSLIFFWHGFGYPNSFCFRFSFLMCLFMLLLSYKSFNKIKSIKLEHYLSFFIVFVVLATIIIVRDYFFIKDWLMYISVALLALYLVILYFYNKVASSDKNKLTMLLILLVFSELFLNFSVIIYKYKTDSKVEYFNSVEIIGNKIKELNDSNSFYRLEKDVHYSYLDSLLFNYNGISTFLTTISDKSEQLSSNIGHYASSSRVFYNLNAGPLIDSLYGVKYFLMQEQELDYKEIDRFPFSQFKQMFFNVIMSDVIVYENPYALSLGYMVSEEVNNFMDIFKEGKISNPFLVQNYFLKLMTDSLADCFKPYKYEKIDNNSFKVNLASDYSSYMMLPFTADDRKQIKIYINGNLYHTYEFDKGGVFKISDSYKGSNIDIRIISDIKFDKEIDILIYYFDDEVFVEDIEKLQTNQLDITYYKGNKIKGKIKVDDYKVLFTTIPYEKGWKILVDGEKVDYYSIYDNFIGLDLTTGEHTIEFEFTPPLIKLGLIISIIASILFIIYIRFEQLIIRRLIILYNKFEEIINYLIAGVLTTIVSIGSYALLSKILHIDYITSSILSFIISVSFAYYVNKKYVFRSNNQSLREMFLFFKYRILSLLIDLLLMIILVSVLFLDDLIAKIIVQVVVVILNYVFSKILIFKRSS